MGADTFKYALRLPNESDIDSAYQLFCKHREDPWSIAVFRASLLKPFCLVCVVDDKLIGFLIINHAADEAEIEEICVDAEYRQKGIATGMLACACEQLVYKNIVRLYLEVRQSNVAAISVYEKFGFELLGRRNGYYKAREGNKEDALLFALKIKTQP